jgi:hypothetical protein
LNNKEIAEVLGYIDTTLKRKFENFLIKRRANLKRDLSGNRLMAMQGNVYVNKQEAISGSERKGG